MEIIQNAIEKLSNSMRIYAENSARFHQLRQVDMEEAINNLDRAFEAKLEAFHSVYELTKNDFQYFEKVDTSLLILLRNAVHHRNHLLFKSWNSEMHLNSGMDRYSGATFLLVNHKVIDASTISEYYYKLEDILDRVDYKRASKYLEAKMGKRNREKLLKLILSDLKMNRVIEYAGSKRFPLAQVYLNIIPIYISAMTKVFQHFKDETIEFKGYDSDVYFKHFTTEKYVDLEQVSYKHLKLP